jgi:hypothetical protein
MSGQSVPVQIAIKAALDSLFSGRVYPQIAPDSTAPPLAVYSSIASPANTTLNHGVSVENARFQLDVYAATYLEAHDLADSARQAMLAIPAPIVVIFTMQGDETEEDLKLHRVIQEYSIWQPRRF